jgi:hypothetical protein
MVIRAPDIYDAIEAAFELVQMIGNIGGEVRVLAVITLHHAVFLVSECARAKPLRSVFDVDVPALFQLFDRPLDEPRVKQGLFREPRVERDSEFDQIIPAIGKLLRQYEIVKTKVLGS